MDVVITKFHKNAVKQIRLALRNYKGKQLIALRL